MKNTSRCLYSRLSRSLSLFACSLVITSNAEALVIGFEGVITVSDPVQHPDISQFDDRFAVGNEIFGSYEIRDGLRDFRPDDDEFGFFLTPLVFFIEDNEFGLSAFASNSASLRVINEASNTQTGQNYDLYDLTDFASSGLRGTDQDGANPVAPDNFAIVLRDLDATVLSDGMLPLTVPDIVNDYEIADFRVFFGAGQINGVLTSMFEILPDDDHSGDGGDPTPVPEPESLFLIAGGLIGILLIRRRRHTA